MQDHQCQKAGYPSHKGIFKINTEVHKVIKAASPMIAKDSSS